MLASLHLMDGETRLREAQELAQSKWRLGVGDGSCGWGRFIGKMHYETEMWIPVSKVFIHIYIYVSYMLYIHIYDFCCIVSCITHKIHNKKSNSNPYWVP